MPDTFTIRFTALLQLSFVCVLGAFLCMSTVFAENFGLGWVSCSLLPTWYIKSIPTPTTIYLLWQKKKWPECHFF